MKQPTLFDPPDSAPQGIRVDIHPSWKRVLEEEFRKPYFAEIKAFILEQKQAGHVVYPPGKLIFNAFNLTPFEEVKVIILGQDPYHGPGQAHGLCFSVPRGVKPPPSLVNIFREVHQDTGAPVPGHGCLETWARQGVFLLNAILTVNARQPASHQKAGWQTFTDQVIRTLSTLKQHLVFMLWGRYAQEKAGLIDASKHLVLTAAHPSPYSANNGFFGCRHFSKANQYLESNGYEPVRWAID